MTKAKLDRLARLLLLALASFPLGFASSGPALAADVDSVLIGAQFTETSEGTIIRPASSIVRASDAGLFAHTNYLLFRPRGAPLGLRSEGVLANVINPFPGYETPASLACIYGVTFFVEGCDPDTLTTRSLKGSRAVAVVVAYHYPTVREDLLVFSRQFNLPDPTIKVSRLSTTTKPDMDWNIEAAIDTQMVHAMAPHALIYLVEAKSRKVGDLLDAVRRAAELVARTGGEVSNSWGTNHDASDNSIGTNLPFIKSGVVFLAATGDSLVPSYPSLLQNVVAVGGTTIHRDGTFYDETPWTGDGVRSGGGVGQSRVIPRPPYQKHVPVGNRRTVPDISAVAAPSSSVVFRYNGTWLIGSGTSVAAPLVAGIINASKTFRSSSFNQLAHIYAKAGTSAFNDVKFGRCGLNGRYVADPAWDFCTGVGTPGGLNGF